MREIAVINTGLKIDLDKNLLNPLTNHGHITVFSLGCENSESESGISFVKLPEDISSSRSKTFNFVYRHYFNIGHKDFLHVIEDRVLVFNDPNAFMNEIEKMMSVFSLKSWYNTVCDVCNYTFMQYNPKFSVCLDSDDVKERYGKTIYFTSHANMSWTCFNYGIATYDDIKLDDRFSVPLYFIVEFLARRRNTKKENELYFMNCYPTIAEERNVFRLLEDYEDQKIDAKQYNVEGELFKTLNVNHMADTAVEPVMESLHYLLTN